MLQKNIRTHTASLLVFLYITLLITSCSPDTKKIETDSVASQMELARFEQDLFRADPANMAQELQQLKNKYGNFFDLFAFQITRLGSRDSVQMIANFENFISDTNFRSVYNQCTEIFGDFKTEQTQLQAAFSVYSDLFPEKVTPRIVTLFSVFSYPIVVDSLNLGISLDMYMGTESRYYYTLDPPLPLFLRNKMRKEYLVPDAMRGWIESDYPIDESRAKIVDMMISQGRLLCILDELFPEMDDTLKSGFSSVQIQWCKSNESKIFGSSVNKSLFSMKKDQILLSFDLHH